MKNLIRSTKKKQMVLELEVNVIGKSKSSKSFSKSCVQNQIRDTLIGNIEVNNQKDISNELYLYYKNLFNERQNVSEHDRNNLLNAIFKFPRLPTEQSLECKKCTTEK